MIAQENIAAIPKPTAVDDLAPYMHYMTKVEASDLFFGRCRANRKN
jgi:hypothetical protein